MNQKVSLKERIKKNFSENKVLLFVFVVLWIVTLIVTYNYYKNTFGKESYGSKGTTEVVEISEGTKLTQVISTDENTETLSIKFANYIRNNKGNIYLKVTGVNSKYVYLNKTINISHVQDNAYVTYSFEKELKQKEDKKIQIELTSDSKEGSSIGVYLSPTKTFEYSELKVNGELQDYELAIKFLLPNKNFETFARTALYLTIILLSVTLLILLVFNPSKEIVFVTFAGTFGLLLMLVISPGAAPDELLHYEKILQISNTMMFENQDTIDEAYLNYDSYGDHFNTSDSYNRFIRDFNKPLELKDKKVDFNYELVETYTGFYIPQAIGVTIARILKVNALKTFYAGRFTNLVFYLFCLYIAIKNTPVKKMLLGVIANVPIFVQQAASYSYDAFINGLILISISFFFKWYFSEEKITKKDFTIVFITTILLAPAKIIYGLFTVVYWFVPVSRFESKKQKILFISLLCLPTVILVLYNSFIRTIGMILDAKGILFYNSANLILADPNEAVAYVGDDYWQMFNIFFILKHPILTIQICARTVRFYLSTWFYQSIGRTLAGTNLVLPMTIIRILLVCICIAALRDERNHLPINIRIVFVLLCIAVASLILIMMLTGWTTRGDIMIKGVQGRYFCPLLPYFFSIFSNNKIKTPNKLDNYVLFVLLIVNFQTIMYVLSFTFVN